MTIELFAHPFSSYCQKALIALYENRIAFEYRHLEHDGVGAALAGISPAGKFPVLREDGRVVAEATMIIEYLDVHHPGATRFLPEDHDAALQVRFMDRFFDNHVGTHYQKLVGDALRPADARDPHGVAEARAALDRAYGWLENYLAGRDWAAGGFGLADCAAGPHLFYADWAHEIPAEFGTLRAYRRRLIERPSFAQAIEEARQYRSYFPLGAPDRD